MSLIRQLWLLLVVTLSLALLGSVSVHLWSARGYLQDQLQLKNSDNAAALALALSQQHGDRALMELLLTAQFDTGAYQQIRFDAADGSAPFVRANLRVASAAPAWFVRAVSIAPVPGHAQVSDGWRALGAVELTSQVNFAYDQLWRGTLQAVAALGAVSLLAGVMGTLAVLRIRRPLAAVVAQAQALVDGRFVTLSEPRQPELRALARAMNSMVGRVKLTFDAQAAQLEKLHRKAYFDGPTGLSNRRHFLHQLETALLREDGADSSGLVLLRLRGLAGLNRTLGHEVVDRVLVAIAETLRTYDELVPGCFLGRLNGADFALRLPVGGVANETAQALCATLRAVLPGLGQGIAVSLGVVELRRDMSLGHALAAADDALARAEARGAYQVEFGEQTSPVGPGQGEGAWRQGIDSALTHGRSALAEFPLIDASGQLIHLECPLRLKLHADGAFEVASRWLPLAVRARRTAEVDLHAVRLALDGIAVDGRQRCVNLAPASLADSAFAGQLRKLLFAAPRVARGLWVEVDEAAAVERFSLLQELARQLRPCGVRLGLEHAGARLSHVSGLFDLGLDFVKLDPSTVRGVASDAQRLNFVRQSVELLHGLSLQVYAEGVNEAADAKALWANGIDGITGPWATAQQGAASGPAA